MPAGAAVARKTSPIVWVLVAVLGLFILGAIGTFGLGLFVVHKARQAGLDTELLQKNPGLAIAKLVATVNPDAEVLSTDDGAGKITVRDKKTGKVVTMTFDDVRKGKFSFEAEGPNNETARFEVGGDTKLPSYVPAYPGAKATGNFAVTGNGPDGQGGGAYEGTFTTSDSIPQVLSFYRQKFQGDGMKLSLDSTTGDQGGMLVAEDEASGRAITIIAGKNGQETSISVTARVKR